MMPSMMKHLVVLLQVCKGFSQFTLQVQHNFSYLCSFVLNCILSDEDWEEEHEKLADFENEVIETRSPKETEAYSIQEGEFTYLPQTPGKILKKEGFGNVEFGRDDEDAANVATTMSQILLEDDDIESILSRPINYSQSMDSKVFFSFTKQLCHYCLTVKSLCSCLDEFLLNLLYLILMWDLHQDLPSGLLSLPTFAGLWTLVRKGCSRHHQQTGVCRALQLLQ